MFVFTHPVGRTEVDSFSEVVALIKPGVISAGECENKLASHLISSYNLQSGDKFIPSQRGNNGLVDSTFGFRSGDPG